MVLIHYKKSETNQFLFETIGSNDVTTVINDLVAVNNARLVLDRLAVSIEELALNGPLKPESLRGLTDPQLIKEAADNLPEQLRKYAYKQKLEPGQRFNEDSNNQRTGVILNEKTQQMMLEEVQKVKKYISVQQVTFKQKLTLKELDECKLILNGVMMIAYPGYHGIEDYEPARQILSGKLDYVMAHEGAEYLGEETSLWWASKELLRGKLLSYYVGKNEKTKIIVKLTKLGGSQPQKEPPVEEETQKKMMAFYYKKQEEMKKLDQDEDDNYMNSSWADPKNLKNSLNGVGAGISWKAK